MNNFYVSATALPKLCIDLRVLHEELRMSQYASVTYEPDATDPNAPFCIMLDDAVAHQLVEVRRWWVLSEDKTRVSFLDRGVLTQANAL